MCTIEEKPECGPTNNATTSEIDLIGTTLDVITFLSTLKIIYGAYIVITTETATTVAEVMEGVIGFAASPTLVAVFAAATATFIVWLNWWEKCKAADGDKKFNACYSGAVDEIIREGIGFHAFSASHPYLKLVTRCKFWPRLELASFIDCNDHFDRSPRLFVVLKSEEVCNAALGGAIGGTIGAVGGAIGGVIAAAAIASLACGPLAWLCAILAILAILAAVALGAYVGATIGSQIGGTAGEDPFYDFSLVPGDLIRAIGPTTNNMNYGGVLSQVFTKQEELAEMGVMPSQFEAPYSWQNVEEQFFDTVPGETEPREIDDGCP